MSDDKPKGTETNKQRKLAPIITICGLVLLIGGGVYASVGSQQAADKIAIPTHSKQSKKAHKKNKQHSVIDDAIQSVSEKAKDSVEQVASALTGGDTLEDAHAAVNKDQGTLVKAATVIAKQPELPKDITKELLNQNTDKGIDNNNQGNGQTDDSKGNTNVIPVPLPDPTPQPQPTPNPEPTPNPTPDPQPAPNPEPTPDPTPDPIPDPVPESTPVITAPSLVTVHVHQTVNLMAGVGATDSVDGDLTNQIQRSIETLDTAKSGLQLVWYTVTNSQGKTTKRSALFIIVNDAPQITANDYRTEVGNDFDTLAGVSASDTEDGDLTAKVQVVENNVDTTKPGSYTEKLKVTDQDGRSTTVSRQVEVYAQSPELDVSQIQTKIEVGTQFDPLQNVKATDPYDGDLPVKVDGVLDTSKVGTYVLTYRATNHYGQTTTKSVTFTVYAEKPTITGIDAKTIQVGEQFDPMAGVKAESKYGQAEIKVKGQVDSKQPGTYTLIYTVKDQYSELNFDRIITIQA